MSLFDPWLDAAVIVQHTRTPRSRLVVLLGAEAWCEKCRTLRPVFDAAAAEDEAAWLWLDLEEHVEFIGDFIPDDLPLLLVYRGTELIHSDIAGTSALERIKQGEYAGAIHPAPDELLPRLLAEDWVQA